MRARASERNARACRRRGCETEIRVDDRGEPAVGYRDTGQGGRAQGGRVTDVE